METKWIFQIQHLFPDRGQQAMLYRATLKPQKSHTHGRLLPVPHILRNEDNPCFHVLWWQGYHYGEWLFFKQLSLFPSSNAPTTFANRISTCTVVNLSFPGCGLRTFCKQVLGPTQSSELHWTLWTRLTRVVRKVPVLYGFSEIKHDFIIWEWYDTQEKSNLPWPKLFSLIIR